jgi:hypothetical protein
MSGVAVAVGTGVAEGMLEVGDGTGVSVLPGMTVGVGEEVKGWHAAKNMRPMLNSIQREFGEME